MACIVHSLASELSLVNPGKKQQALTGLREVLGAKAQATELNKAP